MIITKYKLFKENINNDSHLPTYEDCIDMCNSNDSAFYETKNIIDNFPVSVFNYRLASFHDFEKNKGSRELRGLTFVFNKDGTLYKRFLLLEKFFNLNQVPDSMYSVVKDYKIKHINNKEDGSIASFIQLPNGKIIGKSKMGFDNDQANGINKIYNTNKYIKALVNWSLSNNIVPVFEYVSNTNRIVLRYSEEELILLRLRDNDTGELIEIGKHLDKIGEIRIAPFEDDNTLDSLVELSKTSKDKEGWVVQFENGKMIKIKTQWYFDRHGLLTEDIYNEHKIIGFILDDKIDDILGEIPDDEKEAIDKIHEITKIVRRALDEKSKKIQIAYDRYINSGISKKDYAINQRKGNPEFAFVMSMVRVEEWKNFTDEEILSKFKSTKRYKEALDKATESSTTYEMSIEWLRNKTKRLEIAREWLATVDHSLLLKN